MMEKTDYYTYYIGRGNKTFEERDCLICGDVFVAPKTYKSITVCSTYCRNRRLTLQKLKGVYVLCKVCDKLVWKAPTKKSHYCSVACKNIGYKIFSDEVKRTKFYKKYYGSDWLPQRRRARKRDNYECQMCGIKEEQYGKQLSVHHIKPFALFDSSSKANKLENLLCICEPCHRIIHSGEMHPSKYVNQVIV